MKKAWMCVPYQGRVSVGCSKYLHAPVDQYFGKWLVTGYSHYDNEHYWGVLCTGCNRHFVRRAGQLVRKRTSACQQCNAFEREKYSFWSGIEGMSGQYLTKLKYRKKEITISLEDLVKLWKQQDGKCAYTGESLTLVSKDTAWATSSASLDRIDSSKGYIQGNIQWVHKDINKMKMDLSHERFVELATKIVNGGACGV